ncbi:MAG: hypothetical protein ACI8TQ_003241 [Planctomycetota bacterium]|jgi:hypothetical protein
MKSKDSAKRWVVALLAVIAIVEVAGFAVSLTAASDSNLPSSFSASFPSNPVNERMAKVLERIEQLLDSGSGTQLGTPSKNTGERMAVSSSEDSATPQTLAELVRSLDSLRSSIEQESLTTQEMIRSGSAFGGESMLKLRDQKTDPSWIALEELEQSWHANPEAANRSQYFLTPQDLLKRYGPPTAIYRPQGGLNFYYRKHPKGESGPAWSFRVQDGIVVGFLVDYE